MNPEVLEKPEQNMTAKRLKSLYELIERMNSVYDLQELLEFIVDRTLNLTGGRHGLLLLNDGDEQNLQQVAVIQGEKIDPKYIEEPLQLVSTTVIKDTLAKGEPRLVVDLRADERYSHIASASTHQLKRVRSVLAVPLKVEEELIGLIYIDHPKQAIFGESDLDFLRAFANQAALGINRAKVHQRQIEELTLLNTLSRSVVEVLDLDEVLTRIVHEANRMLGVETGSVLLVDEISAELYFATAISNGQRIKIPTQLQKNQGIAGWVVETGEIACVSDVSQDPRWFGEVETGFNFVTRSLLCVPLQLRGRVLGAIEVFNKKNPLGFSSSDVTLLSAFANSATIAIENARLFQEARQVYQLRALNEVALALSSSLDLETILNMGLEQAVNILRVHASAISFIEGYAALPPVQVSRGLLSDDPGLAQRQIQELNKLAEWVLNKAIDDPLVVDSLHPRPDLEKDALSQANIQALALAPIKVGSKISGALIVMNRTSHPFSSDDIGLLTSIARITGLASQNAIHYNQARSQTMRLTYLSEVGTALTGSLDLQHVLEVIIEGVNSLMETERTSVFLIDPKTNELVLRYSNQGDANIRLPAPWKGIAGWVATHDKPALVNDTHTDPRHLDEIAAETGYPAHSILCVPLKVEDRVIGVVEVLNKTSKQQQFTQEHQVLLTELTRWAAIAIHNAHLFDERVQAYEDLANEHERRIAAEARSSMASVILDMAHTMNNVVGAMRVWAATLEHAADVTPDLPITHFKKEMSHIRENAEEAISLIGSMTDPLKQATIAPTDVHVCLADAIKSCWWPDRVHLSKDYGEDVPLVKANAKRLEAAFNNLLSNAIQALAAGGGHIRVTTRRTEQNWAEIAISDNGPGIPLETQKNLFNPRASSTSQGLGIGLWLVETFIKQFEGTIDFTSTPENGTTFVVTLQPVDIEIKQKNGQDPGGPSGGKLHDKQI